MTEHKMDFGHHTLLLTHEAARDGLYVPSLLLGTQTSTAVVLHVTEQNHVGQVCRRLPKLATCT